MQLGTLQTIDLDDGCSCAFDTDCEEPMAIFEDYPKVYTVPGFVWRCTIFESVLKSSLECLYSDTACLGDLLFHYLNYTTTITYIPPLNASAVNKYPTNATIETLTNGIFVEEWIPTIFYENYFRTCAPYECTYTHTEHPSFLYIATTLLAIYGGLTISLRILAPILIQLFVRTRRERIFVDESPRKFYSF